MDTRALVQSKLAGFRPTKTQVHATGAVGVLALAATSYLMGYVPTVKAQDRASIEQASIDLARAESNSTTEKVERARAKLTDLQAELGQAMRRAADPVQSIRSSASEAGLEVRALTEGQIIEVEDLQRTSLALDATGTFSDISDWLAGAGEAVPGLVIVGLSIATPMGDQDVLSFQASLSVYAPQPTSPGDPSTTEGPTAQTLASPDR